MRADNHKTNGENKPIAMATTISITAALYQANSRLAALPIVEDITDVDDPAALPAPDDTDDNSY